MNVLLSTAHLATSRTFRSFQLLSGETDVAAFDLDSQVKLCFEMIPLYQVRVNSEFFIRLRNR